jgi:hypothetical protein
MKKSENRKIFENFKKELDKIEERFSELSASRMNLEDAIKNFALKILKEEKVLTNYHYGINFRNKKYSLFVDEDIRPDFKKLKELSLSSWPSFYIPEDITVSLDVDDNELYIYGFKSFQSLIDFVNEYELKVDFSKMYDESKNLKNELRSITRLIKKLSRGKN